MPDGANDLACRAEALLGEDSKAECTLTAAEANLQLRTQLMAAQVCLMSGMLYVPHVWDAEGYRGRSCHCVFYALHASAPGMQLCMQFKAAQVYEHMSHGWHDTLCQACSCACSLRQPRCASMCLMAGVSPVLRHAGLGLCKA